MQFDRFRASVARHGLWPSLLRSAYNVFRRLVPFEICRVEAALGDPYDWPDVQGYDTRMVASDELHARLCPELRHLDYRWAFAAGSSCAASLKGGVIVGLTLATFRPTRVRDGVEFHFPREYVYSFASFTAPSHRGKRLEQDRWKFARRDRVAKTGRDPRSIWYVNVTNLESRATSKAVGAANELIGYSAWIQLGRRCMVLNSPGCRRVGAGFMRMAPDQAVA